MHYWEHETANGHHIRISWNGAATFNLQTPIGGEWVDYECFTVYGIDDAQTALEIALDHVDEDGNHL